MFDLLEVPEKVLGQAGARQALAVSEGTVRFEDVTFHTMSSGRS